jgi:hypothetical protein
MKIYVASSWRNLMQQGVVHTLRADGHEVYDFKNPEQGDNGFRWSDVEPDWKNASAERFRDMLAHPIAVKGFDKDMDALKACDACVLVNPCGRSAHLEAGYAVGAGKPLYILLQEGDEPELMYRMAITEGYGVPCVSLVELLTELQTLQRILRRNAGEVVD